MIVPRRLWAFHALFAIVFSSLNITLFWFFINLENISVDSLIVLFYFSTKLTIALLYLI